MGLRLSIQTRRKHRSLLRAFSSFARILHVIGTLTRLLSDEYFDLKMTGLASGFVTLCYHGPAINSENSIDYFCENQWLRALNNNATATLSVCGSILLHAPNETPLAIGRTSNQTSFTSRIVQNSPTTETSSCGSSSTSGTTSPGIPKLSSDLEATMVLVIFVVTSYLDMRRKIMRATFYLLGAGEQACEERHS